MTALPVQQQRSAPLRVRMAEEVRALMARRRLSGVALAALINRSQSYVSRRLTGEVPFDMDDLEAIAAALGVKAADLVRTGDDSAARPTLANVGLPVTAGQPTATDVGLPTRPRDNRPKNRSDNGQSHHRTRQKRALTAEERQLASARGSSS